ncbi:MAG: response regulator [Deltaproteobacteria bacterium]|nr:response regulator [Deltaproteobacteria bacterium]
MLFAPAKVEPVILIVDDQPQNIKPLETYFVLQGYEIVKATNGEEALGKLSGNQIDLILLDVIMPGMDGFEVTRRVRQDNTHRLLPIILITVLWETEDRVKGIEAGCDGFISKPFDNIEILARVKSLLKVKAYNDLMSNYQKELESEVIRRTEESKHALENLQQEITERKKAEEQLQRTLDSLRKAVNTTIQVMVSAVETRDPYTAGHQIRSANLARAIATEMGLPPEKVEGIRMAGSIHDIGKLSIPAEILSKPTKLSETEFSLIKEHARQGYEILKNVESPWPLAEIVRQHHERMDGSGYPRNLKGEEICMEARILAVSDVVESMASHRPYRPGLGIHVALEEIEKNSGTLYDNTVADACLRLFREKGFKLEGT